MTNIFQKITTILLRKKVIDDNTVSETKLNRCLSTLDLTALGVGSTLGAGIYVLSGQVAKDKAGPAVIFSFLIAALASILSGLCYAEFGARVPKAGSAYVYSYVTVGELWAFIIGWNLILEYVIGTASVARAWTLYIDTFTNNSIASHLRNAMPINAFLLSPYPDFVSFSICFIMSIILASGVKATTKINFVFTGLNLLVVIYSVIVGAFKADVKNWKLKIDDILNSNSTNGTVNNFGYGGFAPYGIAGVLSGAATCFYAFVGFDAIATTGEEVKNPRKSIPISIIASLLICCIAYLSMSSIITLMVPYYLLDKDAPLPLAFNRVGYTVAQYVVTIGALFGLTTSLLGAMFPMPRVIYSMASDGLIFRFLSVVNTRFQTPARATILSGLLSAIMAMFFDLQSLVDMMSIGTLLAYTLVAASVLLLRYKEAGVSNVKVTYCLYILCLFTALFSIYILVFIKEIKELRWWALLLVAKSVIIMIISSAIFFFQKQNNDILMFKVPCVPLIPLISVTINIFLMFQLPWETWVRFGIWMIIGFLIYFGYGVRNSSLNELNDENRPLTDNVTFQSTLSVETTLEKKDD